MRLIWARALLLMLAVPVCAQNAPEMKLPLRDGSLRFAVIGDNGTGDAPQFDIGNQMERYRKVVKYDFAIMNGDNIYSGHSSKDFQRKFEQPYADVLKAGVKFYACLGNHDDPDIERNYGLYNMGGERFYTFSKGDVQFFVLDSNYMDPHQMGWLNDQLSKSKAKWKIAYFHHPLFTAAKYHGPSMDLRAQLMPVFTRYGVNVVFYGHEHVYERIKPQQGIYFFLEGNSGQLRYHNLNARKTSELDEVGIDTDNTFMLIEIDKDELFYQTMGRDGHIVDAGTFKRQNAGK